MKSSGSAVPVPQVLLFFQCIGSITAGPESKMATIAKQGVDKQAAKRQFLSGVKELWPIYVRTSRHRSRHDWLAAILSSEWSGFYCG